MKTKNPKPAHVEDIHKYTLELSKEIETAPDIGDWLNEQLSLEIWKKEGVRQVEIKRSLEDSCSSMPYRDTAPRYKNVPCVESWKAEILITMGGPTVCLEIDSRHNCATLYHSWGWTDSHGEKLEWATSETATEILKDFIEDCCLN